jgi:hypothetical protein
MYVMQEKPHTQPTLIMVWIQNPLAGLGDLLRGTMRLHELSKEMNFRFIVDTQLHPVSKYLSGIPHEYSDYVLKNQDKIIHLVNCQDGKQQIANCLMIATSASPILVFSNDADGMLHKVPSFHSSLFMRKLMHPTEEFKTQFNAMCNEFKIGRNYSIMHFRVGDDDLVNHTINVQKYKEMLIILDATVKQNDNTHIISDSFAFKQYLGWVRPHLANRIIPTKPIHLSHSNANDAEMIKDTMFDFFLLMHAKTIKTYTNYTWVSGFVQWISYAFNVPLINVNANVRNVQTSPSIHVQKKNHLTPMRIFANPNPRSKRMNNSINMQFSKNY